MTEWRPLTHDDPDPKVAPWNGEPVLLYFPSGAMQVGQWDDSPGFPPAFMNAPDPTHWAHLPEPPK